ncbi:MAG: hypothetical protein Q4E73_05200 [Lachnospiraceae bacterium]|nr:hypothetical protein [Lachnospiraceae bacterium]
MYLVFIAFALIYFLIYQNAVGGCLLGSLFLILGYSYYKGKKMITNVDISFNEHKKIYRQGEKFQLNMEVPKQQIFETREIEIEVFYTSVIDRKTVRQKEILLLQRRADGKVSIEYEVKQSDWITVEIKGFIMYDLCGCFRFQKEINFEEKILVFPKDYPIEDGEISESLEEYGNIRLFGNKNCENKTEPVIYLDLENLIYEEDMLIRRNYLTIVYSISSALLLHRYRQRFLLGDEQYVIDKWEDYLPLFQRIFEVIAAERPLLEPRDMSVITHAITTKNGLPVPGYHGKTIAVVGKAIDIDNIYALTEYVIVQNMKEDLFHLSL